MRSFGDKSIHQVVNFNQVGVLITLCCCRLFGGSEVYHKDSFLFLDDVFFVDISDLKGRHNSSALMCTFDCLVMFSY